MKRLASGLGVDVGGLRQRAEEIARAVFGTRPTDNRRADELWTKCHGGQVGICVSCILKGEKPRPSELVINLQKPRALGINVPTQLLARADE